MKHDPAVRALALLVLFALAAGYFALGCTLTLEWGDEGHLIYQSWRVSDGATASSSSSKAVYRRESSLWNSVSSFMALKSKGEPGEKMTTCLEK